MYHHYKPVTSINSTDLIIWYITPAVNLNGYHICQYHTNIHLVEIKANPPNPFSPSLSLSLSLCMCVCVWSMRIVIFGALRGSLFFVVVEFLLLFGFLFCFYRVFYRRCTKYFSVCHFCLSAFCSLLLRSIPHEVYQFLIGDISVSVYFCLFIYVKVRI